MAGLTPRLALKQFFMCYWGYGADIRGFTMGCSRSKKYPEICAKEESKLDEFMEKYCGDTETSQVLKVDYTNIRHGLTNDRNWNEVKTKVIFMSNKAYLEYSIRVKGL